MITLLSRYRAFRKIELSILNFRTLTSLPFENSVESFSNISCTRTSVSEIRYTTRSPDSKVRHEISGLRSPDIHQFFFKLPRHPSYEVLSHAILYLSFPNPLHPVNILLECLH